MTCRFECSCPSQLHHDVSGLIARYDAPIPPPSREEIVNELRGMLATDKAEADASFHPTPGFAMPPADVLAQIQAHNAKRDGQ